MARGLLDGIPPETGRFEAEGVRKNEHLSDWQVDCLSDLAPSETGAFGAAKYRYLISFT